MARRTEEWWAKQSPAVQTMRCVGTNKKTGNRCLGYSEPGSVNCRYHGGAAPQVRRRAAERVLMTADEAAANLVRWMNDGSLPWGERVKIARDLLDRGGLAAAQVHKIIPLAAEDPVEALFKSILEDPDGLMPMRPVDPPSEPPALDSGEVVPGQVIDPVQDAYERYAESHQPDAEVVRLDMFGKPGPHDYRGKKSDAENGDPEPAPPVPGWRPPDDVA